MLSECRHVSLSALQGMMDAGLSDKACFVWAKSLHSNYSSEELFHLSIYGFLFTPGLWNVPPIQPFFIPLIYNKESCKETTLRLTQQSANTGQCLGWRVKRERVQYPICICKTVCLISGRKWGYRLCHFHIWSILQNTVAPKVFRHLNHTQTHTHSKENIKSCGIYLK